LLSDPPGNDIFIAEEDLGGALSGDLVAVEMKRRKLARQGRERRGMNWSRPAGRVVKILERAHPRIVGTFQAGPQGGRVVPDTPGVFHDLDVLPDDRGEAKHRDKVAIELVEPDPLCLSPFSRGRKPGAQAARGTRNEGSFYMY
jgi:ribonuclease R